jgi:hypothetical protein
LAIVTEASGGYGDIAQYNRDLFEAMSASPLSPIAVANKSSSRAMATS